MDYFSKFLKPGGQVIPKVEVIDHALEFHKSWTYVKTTLLHPDERQLSRGIKSTDVPTHLKSMVDALVWESTRTEEGGTGACLEYLLKNDVLGILVKLSETDRPSGIQAEVLRSVQNMVVLMDEQFLVHSAVHKAVLRLLRSCVGDDIQEQLDGRNRIMGAAGTAKRSQPSEYEEDLVNLLCILCSRIRNYRELLMIFFHDKQWYRPEPLFSVEEEDEDEDEDEGDEEEESAIGGEEQDAVAAFRNGATSPTPSERTVKSGPSEPPPESLLSSTTTKKPEYEFLLFNYLLRFVHREGQIGDFARAGLLFLMDVAMSPVEAPPKPEDFNSSTSTTSSTDNDPNTDAALALAEYILDGDFSEVLAAGLAAVYSVLPTKLEISRPAKAGTTPGSTMVLGASGDSSTTPDGQGPVDRPMGLEESSSPDFGSRLDHFLKLLEFLQDVLRRNIAPDTPDENLDPSTLVGSAIAQSILNAVRRVFFENVLYPSILECSDLDGSAVAVMSYIEISLRTLGVGQLGDLLVDFLMSEDNTTEDLTHSRMRPHSFVNLSGPPPAVTGRPDRATRARRRKSTAMALLEMEAPDTRRPSEYFTSMGRFTLKDLLLSSLRSRSHATATTALQLLQSLMQIYCRECVDRLLLVIPDPYATSYPYPLPLPAPAFQTKEEDEEAFVYPGAEDASKVSEAPIPPVIFPQPDTTYYTHEREMGLYLTLVSRVDPNHAEDAFSTGYDHYLRDALLTIQTQDCTLWDVDPAIRGKAKHRLNPNDPILSSVLENLRKFFSNTPELNMALTGVLATLAVCPDRSLAGWLTFTPKDPDFSSSFQDESIDIPGSRGDGDDRSIDFAVEEKLLSESHSLPATSIDEQSRPVVHSIFHGLVSQLERYRQMVDDFDKYLRERRQGLLFNENLTDALTLVLELDGTVPPKSTTAPAATSSPAPSEPSTPKAKSKPKTSSFVSFLTPKKSKAAKATPEPATQSKTHKALDASPFGTHYERTNAIAVEPFLAPRPSSGPWTPAKSKKWNSAEEDVFTASSQWGGVSVSERPGGGGDEEDEESEGKPTTVTLSRLLDNVVILEESLKELIAIIHARRSLGIDAMRYL
ncbi:Retinoic acid induced 16-like protein-domain-containing protein [Cristinia sonorae]|uniref:Retinoic acid induced 16-like protein-domain-containing protein n=1 Tax=Cristinia sonorae TaxID=1940300 RepID=A0A8K0UYR3_9AGAR|nr:Retinoic acid induced 16-like protein-domain-containing protein [Cristinia sonorae]